MSIFRDAWMGVEGVSSMFIFGSARGHRVSGSVGE